MSLSELWNALLSGLGQALAFFYDLIPNYGVAIILLTVAVKIVTLPLTIKSTKSMQAMQKMQPEIKRIQAKYKGDRQKVQEETMKLYSEHGVNPAGGCLPLLLQMPVFFALFQVFQRCGVALRGEPCPPNQIGVATLPAGSALRVAIVGGHAGFLGMQLGLSPLAAYRVDGVLAAVPYFLLILFMAATSWYQQKQMSASQTGPPNPQTQMISRVMVLVFPVLAVNWPIALTLYWTVNNLWTIGQQYFLLGDNKRGGSWLARLPAPLGPRTPIAPTGEAGGGNPGPSSSSGKHKGSGARKGKKRR